MADRDSKLSEFNEWYPCNCYECDEPLVSISSAKQAMDEYMEVTVLEAFDYVAKHVQNTMITDAGVSMFLVDNNWIEKEELFKNFL